VTAECPEPLCPNSALPSWGRRLAPSRKALPFLHRSYWLMRQAFTLLPISGYALIRKVFAGCCQPPLRKGSSQRYLCRPSLRAGTPTPAAPKVLSPVSSPGTLAFPERTRVGAWLRSTTATSDGEVFWSCSHSVMFRPTGLFASQVAPTLTLACRAAETFTAAHITVGYLPRAAAMLTIQTGQLMVRGLAPLRSDRLVGYSVSSPFL
jgi:hypothetical protein